MQNQATSLPVSRILAAAVAVLVATAFTGCATFNRIAHYPGPTESTTVSIAAKPMSKMSELPIGAYYDVERHVIVTGHQKGLFTGMLFGVVGVVVADQMNKSSGKDKFGDEVEKSADLGAILGELLDASLAGDRAAQWSREAANAGLQLTPYAVFTVGKNGDTHLYAMLRAERPATGKDARPVWSGRYFARAPGVHPLTEEGWMAGNVFPESMRAALASALEVCIDDTHGRLTGTKRVKTNGRFPYLNMDLKLPAIVVQERPDALVVKLVVGDAMVLAGTHVLARDDYTFEDADFKDPRK